MAYQDRYDPLEDLTEAQMEQRQRTDSARSQHLHDLCPFRRNQRGYGLWITWAKGIITGQQMGKEPRPEEIAEFRRCQGLTSQPWMPRAYPLVLPRRERYRE